MVNRFRTAFQLTGTALFIWLAIVLTGFAAWITHIARCLTEEQWGFLIAGAIFFPVAIVHGIGIWLGIW